MIRYDQRRITRRGFTLLELLVVITIIVILLAITVPAINFGLESERVRGGASQIQSFLAGARDRAIYGKESVGVRLFLDNPVYTDSGGAVLEGNRRTVSAMAYINPGQVWSDGTIRLERLDGNLDGTVDTMYDLNGDGDIGDSSLGEVDLLAETAGQLVYVVAGEGTGWWELKRRGLLIDGLTIQIPAGGRSYPVNTGLIDTNAPPDPIQRLILEIPYREAADTPDGKLQAFNSGGPNDYQLTLAPTILPAETSVLPDGVVIDLDGSRIPAAWSAGSSISASTTEFSLHMDIVFSPRGNVIGEAASSGLLHLYVCDSDDSISVKEMIAVSLGATDFDLAADFSSFLNGQKLIPPEEFRLDLNSDTDTDDEGEQYLIGDRRIVSVLTQTGAISVHAVNPVDVLDPFDLDGDTFLEPQPPSYLPESDGIADDPFLFAETSREAN